MTRDLSRDVNHHFEFFAAITASLHFHFIGG